MAHGLDCLPYRDGLPPTNFDDSQLGELRTHPVDEPCPFSAMRFPKGIHATCCSLHAELVVPELMALGANDFVTRLYEYKTATKTRAFGVELRRALGEMRRQAISRGRQGARHEGTLDRSTDRWTDPTWTSLDVALDRVRLTAEWHLMVGKMGFGVLSLY